MLLRPASGGGGIRTLGPGQSPISGFETARVAENRLQIGTVRFRGERLRERKSSQILEGTRCYRRRSAPRVRVEPGCDGSAKRARVLIATAASLLPTDKVINLLGPLNRMALGQFAGPTTRAAPAIAASGPQKADRSPLPPECCVHAKGGVPASDELSAFACPIAPVDPPGRVPGRREAPRSRPVSAQTRPAR
jgi:hypothetical protein